MQLLTEMTLPSLPLHTAEFDRDPMKYINAARLQHPWIARTPEGYLVHGYNAIKDLSVMDDKLAPSFDGIVDVYGAQGTDWGRWMQEHIIAISGPDHVRIRHSVARAFTPAAINKHRPLMRDCMTQLLDDWTPRGAFDFAEFAASYPISVLCGMLGTPTADIPAIRHALETQGRVVSFNRDLLPELLAGFELMSKYVDDLILGREVSGPLPDGSLIDTLIATKDEGQISERELRDLLLVLFPAGYDTSKNTLTMTTYIMLEHPEYWARCAEDVEFCAKVIDEMFRFASVSAAFRKVKEDFVYDDVKLPGGTRLFFANPVAGRDPAAFADAGEFQPERPPTANRHVAFGRGAHMCIGQHLARAQLTEGLHLVAQRLRNPRLVGNVEWRDFLGHWGLNTLPIAFDPV